MSIASLIERGLTAGTEGVHMCLPRRAPSGEGLAKARIVSHRGEHDNRNILENSLGAFDLARDHGVWGIEFDIRWTRDLEPVVFHDLDCARLFGSAVPVRSLTLTQLRKDFPLIPTLEEVIARYGGKTHLMVEIKTENYREPARQNEKLASLFQGLEGGKDYHLISLDSELFNIVDFSASSARLLVAQFNTARLSRIALERGYGGLTGHYQLLGRSIMERHRQQGQKIGTGFPMSRNSLYREVNRGVDWIFTNHAVKLQSICNGD